MDSLLDETDAEDLNMVALRPRMPIRERSSYSKQRDQIVQNSGDFQFDRLTDIWTDGQSLSKKKSGYTVNSCGRVGRGRNARFHTFQLDHYGPTDQRTNGRTKPLIELRVRN